MARTYEQLRDAALKRVGHLGQSDTEQVAEAALEEAMKFVAYYVRIPSLIGSATATAGASPMLESNAITLSTGGFNITSTYQAPDRLNVKRTSADTDIGIPYTYYEYHVFQDLRNIPGLYRYGLSGPAVNDESSDYAYTITPDGKLWATPLAENNILTLYFRKSPAAYSGSAYPEILPLFDTILVNAAETVLKEFVREPEAIVNMWELFERHLIMDIDKYDQFINGQYNRSELKMHRSYRIY